MSLFEKLGGKAALDPAVDIFYGKVLANADVKDFFDGVDMDKQRAKQKAFLTVAFGGPNKYTGQDMRTAHKPLVAKGLNDHHFDTIVALLAETLTELGVGQDDINEVAKVAESVRDDVLDR